MDRLHYFQPGTWVKAGFLPVMLMGVAVLLAVVLRRGPGLRAIRLLVGLSALLASLRAYLTSSSIDFQVFYHAGLDTLQGRNPYLATHPGVMPFLYPPNVLPLFCGLALLDYQTSRALWIGLNVACSLALAPLAWIALRVQDPSWPSLRPEVRGALAAFVPMTTAAALTIDVGQLSLWVAVAAFLALAAQSLRRPVIAGLCLSLALFKATTAIPLLVLYLRKSDRISWGVLVTMSLFLSLTPRLSANPIEDLKTASMRIAENARVGAINDYSLFNEYSYSIIGIDHTLSRLGLGHRRAVGLMQLGILALICCWLAWEVLRNAIKKTNLDRFSHVV